MTTATATTDDDDDVAPPVHGETKEEKAAREGMFAKLKRKTANAGHATGLRAYKTKKQAQNQLLKSNMEARKKQFGVDYLNLKLDGCDAAYLQSCLDEALYDLQQMQQQIERNNEKMETKEEVVQEKIASTPAADTDAPEGPKDAAKKKEKEPKKENKKPLWRPVGKRGEPSGKNPNQDYYPEPEPPGKPAAPVRKAPSPSSQQQQQQQQRPNGPPPPKKYGAAPANNGQPAKSGPTTTTTTTPTGKHAPFAKKGGKAPAAAGNAPPRAGGGAKAAAAAAAAPIMATTKGPTAYQNVDATKWNTTEVKFNGSTVYETVGKQEQVKGHDIKQAIQIFKAHPAKYSALFFQSNMLDWPSADKHAYTLVHREGTAGFKAKDVSSSGWMTMMTHEYQRLPPFKDNVLPKKQCDKYTDNMTYGGRKLHSKTNKPLMPGRGMGVGDTPLLKVIGDVDPSDIHQGTVGDCWLLSGISALAEFDGAIKHLYRKTKHLENMPHDNGQPNMYTITLWDLTTWKEVDIVVDERLPAGPDGRLLAAKPSEDGELWVCYIEKAIACLAGGWDKLVGGQCTHAWALMTGCRNQYNIMRNPKTGKFACYGRYNVNKDRWAKHGNSPHDGEIGMWPMPWPEVGGGGEGELTEDELFLRMVAWDKVNYIVGAGTGGTSDKQSTEGLVDNHAYSVIESRDNVCGTGIGLLKVRNPWGTGEIENGEFDDDGPGWDRYPQIKKELNPVMADDGIFWVTKKEFFKFYQTIFLSASNMTEFLED